MDLRQTKRRFWWIWQSQNGKLISLCRFYIKIKLMIKQILLVGLGGGIGSIARYLISVYTYKSESVTFPFATFLVNMLGCLLIGLLIGLSLRFPFFDKDMKLLLVTGFCGGYTTFSTFALENLQLIQNGHYYMMAAYVLSSVIVGLFAVYCGYFLLKLFWWQDYNCKKIAAKFGNMILRFTFATVLVKNSQDFINNYHPYK